MALPWPAMATVDGNLSGPSQQLVKQLLDQWADLVVSKLATLDLPSHASPVFRPWNLFGLLDSEKVIVVFTSLQGGMPRVHWIDDQATIVDPDSFARQIEAQLGTPAAATVTFPRSAIDGADVVSAVSAAAQQHVSAVEREHRLRLLGDITGFTHLEAHLRTFLDDHPNPARNVFIMMRFIDTPQMNAINATIKDTLRERGFEGLRADDRDYTGELWSNIEVYLLGCQFGVAVFEDIEDRDFNANVSLELGHMLGRRRRSLILKEQRLPDLPADVMHRLYKPFDMFNIEDTVRAQVLRWTDVDLALGPV